MLAKVCMALLFFMLSEHALSAQKFKATHSEKTIKVAAKAAKPATTRDFQAIENTGRIRVLMPAQEQTHRFRANEHLGHEPLGIQKLEQFLNAMSPSQPIQTEIIVRPKDNLLKALSNGEGDLVVSQDALNVGDEAIVKKPTEHQQEWVLVQNRQAPKVSKIEDLSGKSVGMPARSQAMPTVRFTNTILRQMDISTLKTKILSADQTPEQVLALVNKGALDYAVVDKTQATRLRGAYTNILIDNHLVLQDQQPLNWYLNKNAVALQDQIERFLTQTPPRKSDGRIADVYKKDALGAIKVHRAEEPAVDEASIEKQSHLVTQAPISPKVKNMRFDYVRLASLRPVLQKHAKQNKLDWISLAAIALQESGWNPSAKGAGGATGLMQMTPAAARSVGIKGYHQLDKNVEAAARYLAQIRRDYLPQGKLQQQDHMAFLLASYNMGPNRLKSVRNEAKRRGLDPNRWDKQVERVAKDMVGPHVVKYVNNINTYMLALDQQRHKIEKGASRVIN